MVFDKRDIGMTQSLYDIEITTIEGKKITLEAYKGKTLLIVNVASRCGFTSQYKDLEALYQEYKEKDFVILGFPCNQFLKQEPGANEEIKLFAESCFNVTFPLFAKIDVMGKNQAALYSYLQKHIEKKMFKFIVWNFCKILVDKEGRVLKRFLPTHSFTTLRKTIQSVL